MPAQTIHNKVNYISNPNFSELLPNALGALLRGLRWPVNYATNNSENFYEQNPFTKNSISINIESNTGHLE